MEKEYGQPSLDPEKPKSFSEKDAEKLVKAAMGENVFKRPEPGIEENPVEILEKNFEEYQRLAAEAETGGDLKNKERYENLMHQTNLDLVDALINQGRIDEAKDLMKNTEDYKKEKMKNFEQLPQPAQQPEQKPEVEKSAEKTAEEQLEIKFEETKPAEEKPAKPEELKLETTKEWLEETYGKKEETKEEKPVEQPKEEAKEKIEPEKAGEVPPSPLEKKEPSERLKAQVEKAKKEKYGEDSMTKEKLFKLVGKGAIDTIGSLLGKRIIWEVPKLYRDWKEKKKLKGELSDTTLDLLQSAQLGKKIKIEKGEPDERGFIGKPLTAEQKKKREELEKRAGEKRPVLAKIKELNAKLKEAKMSSKDKENLRTEYAQILKEYRHKGKDLEEAKTEKTGRLLDLYINNSAQKMVVARETFNALSLATLTPWLRLPGYAAFAGLERTIKASQVYDKKHFREAKGWKKSFGKIGSVAKNLTIDSARETFHGLSFNLFNKEAKKGGFQKSAEFASSFFMVMRAAGLLKFEHQLQTGDLPTEGIKKFWEYFKEGDLNTLITHSGKNWFAQEANLYSKILSFGENPYEAVKKAMEAKSGAPKSKTLFEIIQEEGKGKKQEELGRQILEKAQGEYQEKLGKEIAEIAKKEFIAKIATVGKGEGIEHSFIRQFENDPQGFGYKGDPNKFTELHRWAQEKAHETAIKNDFYDPSTGEETRVIFDAKHPQQFILNKDESVEVINRNTYGWKPHEETKSVLEKAQEMAQKTPEEVMAESQRIQEETSERLRIFNYKTEHNLLGESDEKVKELMNQETHKEFLREQVNIPGETPAPVVKETVVELQKMGVPGQVIEKIPEKDLAQIDSEHFKGEIKKLEEFKAVQDELAHPGMSPEDYGKAQWGEKATPAEMEKLIQKEISHPPVSEQVIPPVHEPAPVVKEKPAPEFYEKTPQEVPSEKAEKITELEKAGVAPADIEQLTEKDIQTLTPEQIEALPELEEKTQMLREAGVSQEDIAKLSEEDVKNLTPEQIKEIAKEAGTAAETVKEGKVEEIARGMAGTETVGGLISMPDGTKMIELKESGIKSIFQYTPEGKVGGVQMTGPGDLLKSRELLQENWRESVSSHLKGGSSSLHWNRVEGQAMRILNLKKILESMGKSGLGKSLEAEFLKKQVEGAVESLEKQYGDVFK